MADPYTKVAELTLKLDINMKIIERDLIVENDEDFINNIEK
jgi:hypothetical protein